MKQKTIIALIVILAILIIGYLVYQVRTGEGDTEKTSLPVAIGGELSLLGKPLLNTPVALTMIVKSLVDFSNISAQIELPDGFEFVDGDPVWGGDISTGEEQRIEVVVQSTKVGYHQLKGSIKSETEGVIGGSNIVYVEVTEDDAIIGGKPENNWYRHDEPAKLVALPGSVNNNQINSELVFSDTPKLDEEFTITYRVNSIGTLPSETIGLVLVFPPNAFEIVDVEFPPYPVAGELQTWTEESGENTSLTNSTETTDTRVGWRGRIGEQQSIELTVTFKVISTGWGNIYGSLRSGGEGEISELVRDVKLAEIYIDKYEEEFSLVEGW